MNFSRRDFLTSGVLALGAASPAGATIKRVLRGRRASLGATLNPTRFIMGAWLQDASTMAYWAGLGLNTQVSDYGNGGTQAEWKAAAIASGQQVIMSAYATRDDYNAGINDNYVALANDPDVVALFQWDEPDLQGPAISVMNAEHAVARAKGNYKPFMINFRNDQTGIGYPGGLDYVNLAAADMPASDQYGWNGGAPYIFGDLYAADGFSGPFTTMSGHAADVLYRGPWHGTPIDFPGRPTLQFLASGRVTDPAWFSPPVGVWQTAAQYRLQFWSCIINGVSGIINFPQYFPSNGDPMVPNDTSAELAGAIQDAAAKVAILEGQPLGNVLMDTVNGGRRAYTLRRGAYAKGGGSANYPTDQPSFAAVTGNQLPAWFEGAEIVVGAETYRLVVNLHDTLTKSLTDASWGLTGNSFTAGQPKCFKASAPTVDILA